MKTKQKGRIVVSILALASLVAFSLMSYAGSLEPTNAPGPTMKTLDEGRAADSNSRLGFAADHHRAQFLLSGGGRKFHGHR
jgi:hypothetical protein